MSKEFGNRVKGARIAQGLSQVDLAAKVGVTQGAISSWELGNSEPRTKQRADLEQILGPLRRKRESSSGSTGADEIAQPGGAFGAWLQRVRSQKGLSIPELASAADISAVAIYNIEAGKSLNPRKETKRKLATALKVEVPADIQQDGESSQEIIGLGSLMDFDPHNPADLPQAAGVYVFYDISERPIYVGKASNIAKRVTEHGDAFWFKYPLVANAAYVEVNDDDLRHKVEQVLIRFLKSNAVINKQSVVR